MAVPSLGKCSVVLVLVLVLCTSHAFRIRDAVLSSNAEQSRSSVCTGTSHAKCPGDESPTDSLPSSLSGSVPVGTRKRYDTGGSDAPKVRTTSKTRKPPVVADASDESLARNYEKGHGGRILPLSKLDKWTGGENRRAKHSRLEAKDDETSDQDVASEEEEDVDDGDDDGVEITNCDEGTEETIDSAADDDENDNSDADEEAETEELSEASDVTDEEVDSQDDKSDLDDDEENAKQPVEKVAQRDTRSSIGRFNRLAAKRDRDGSPVWANKVPKENGERSPRKRPQEERTTVEEVDDKYEETDTGEDEDFQQPTAVVKETTRAKRSDITKKVDEEPRKRDLEKDEVQGSQEDDNHEDEDDKDENEKDGDDQDDDGDDEDDDDDDEKTPTATPVPLRKLERVRLADKEKSKSPETSPLFKPEIAKPQKPVTVETSVKATEGTRQKKDNEKPESTKSTKPETISKTNVSSKLPKDTSSITKSEAPKKSTTKPTTTTTTTTTITKDAVKKSVDNIEKPPVDKNKDGGSVSSKMVKKSDMPSSKIVGDVKKADKKLNDAVATGNKSHSVSKKRMDASMSLTELNDALLRLPNFLPNFTAIEDPACQQHGKIFLRQLRGYKLWALQMFDASAKIPSGLLRGNINQFGDFDECLGITARVKVEEKTVKVQGKYCLAKLDIHASIPDMKVPVNFMQSRGLIRGSMRDPGHFVPRFTTANWAMCIPAACSAKNAQIAIESALNYYNNSLGLRFSIEVDTQMCYVRQKSQSYTKETIGVLYFYAMIVCIVLVATVRDYVVSPQGKGSYSERIIMSFSLRRTFNILTKEEMKGDREISCIHGIRSLATIALYVAHKLIPSAQIPYSNRIFLTEASNNPISSVMRTSLAYTDCFLLLSGVLTASNMARESMQRGEIRWFCRFIARFIRLTPGLLVTVFWYAYVMEHVGSGPQWNRVIVTNSELCKQNSWTNLLYIQNFFPFEEMCATHTHQLALDMQLSLIAPILVFFFTLKPVIGILVMFFVLQVSATFRYFAVTNNNLSLVVFHGMTVKQLYKTANLTYTLPLHRATPYVFGVGLGVLLHYTGKNIRMYKIFVIFGWITATALGTWSLFSPWPMARRDYVYDVEEAAHYAVIAPVTWSLTLCWIIFACFTNHGGFVNKFLSSYWMILFSRISYAVYLCQFAVFFYNVGTTRYSSELQVHNFIDPFEAAVVTLVSVVLTLFIDIPMQEVKNVIMESTDVPKLPITEKEETKKVADEVPAEEEKKSAILAERSPENQDDVDKSRTWNQGDDAIDDLTRIDDSGEEEHMERWRPAPRTKNGQERSYVRTETYDDEDETELEDEEEVEEEEERPTEWSWVRQDRSRIPPEDDDLMGQRSGRSSQQGSYMDDEAEYRQSATRQYQRDQDPRRERRSLSRQVERSLLYEESPRSSTKRERSIPRAPEARIQYPGLENSGMGKRSSRPDPRGSSISREFERATSLPSRESSRRERSPKRDRSSSRASESRINDVEDPVRSYSRSELRAGYSERELHRTLSRESSRHERSPSRAPMSPKREIIGLLSSGSEEEALNHREAQKSGNVPRKQLVEPKVSDEEDWEQELRVRRKKFLERLASEDREIKVDEGNDSWNSVKRRSSAEGKLALLKDPTGSNVMDSWTVSRGPRFSLLGSSQETEDESASLRSRKDHRQAHRESSVGHEDRSEEESSLGQSRRRSYTSASQVTSLEEEEEDVIANNDFILNKDSKRITVMDLSKWSQQDESPGPASIGSPAKEEQEANDGRPIMATLKLFKRESIVKSQASEEDPEYLLPERPKLMEQEQDHPFKKAWQLQKSRSEEDPSAYSLKDVKSQQDTSRNRIKPSSDKDKDVEESQSKKGLGGPRSSAESSNDQVVDSTWVTRSLDIEDRRSSSKSTTEDSSKFEWPSEDESHEPMRSRRSDDVNYEWELEET